jgi:hypothetical protein
MLAQVQGRLVVIELGLARPFRQVRMRAERTPPQRLPVAGVPAVR